MSPQAAAWLKAEIAYIADRNPIAARKIAARMRQARQNLAEHPALGRAGLIPGTRRLVVPPYVLTIRQRGATVEIAAIRHARQSDAYAPGEAADEVLAGEPTDDTFEVT
jgi:plasmid stabilization system protein ParE